MRYCKLLPAFLLAATLSLAPAGAGADARALTIVALGDSLTAGYMLGPDEDFASQLEAALKEAGHENVKIANAGVSGDTSSGGLARLDWAVGPDADAVIVELGANDALRAIDPAVTRENLDAIVTQLKARGLPVLLAGMLAPPNLGAEYGAAFNAIHADLAETHGLILYPFFLDGVAGERRLNLGDGIHPTAEGIGIIVERILPQVEELIAQAKNGDAVN
ncbi:MAG: arylesterase [Parvibaculum sp.]|uniref:arylesterase n=1 Tax=Parvibaculum sp. TaxID=2024848 RepID=UPI002718ADFE|nr:arylesterase [Parvibaculum sp.]MDO8837698.1 arylesterase [Parvibaculum sp.]